MTISAKTATILLPRDVGTAWGRRQVEELAHSLEQRLGQGVAACFPGESLTAVIEPLAEAGCGRLVLAPLSLLPVIEHGEAPRSILAGARRRPDVQIHIAAPLSWREWSSWLGQAALGAAERHRLEAADTALLVVGAASDNPLLNANLARLAQLLLEEGPWGRVMHAFVDTVRPGIHEALRYFASAGTRRVIAVPWLLSAAAACQRLLRELEEIARPYQMQLNLAQPTLAHPTLVNALVARHFAALAAGLVDLSAATAADSQTAAGNESQPSEDHPTLTERDAAALRDLEQRINALLPPEYQGRYDQVNPESMGTASLIYDRDGRVAWDEIWTSFCDLALAGGPPHRGALLEAVPAADALAEREPYEAVVAEIERGIRLVTRLPIVTSPVPGWVGLRCDSEAMAIWLLRAIIVENVMVRREGQVLYLPAGPRFTLKHEIKNVITTIAKTVHYWTAHLRAHPRASAPSA